MRTDLSRPSSWLTQELETYGSSSGGTYSPLWKGGKRYVPFLALEWGSRGRRFESGRPDHL